MWDVLFPWFQTSAGVYTVDIVLLLTSISTLSQYAHSMDYWVRYVLLVWVMEFNLSFAWFRSKLPYTVTFESDLILMQTSKHFPD